MKVGIKLFVRTAHASFHSGRFRFIIREGKSYYTLWMTNFHPMGLWSPGIVSNLGSEESKTTKRA